jgi:GT2 family glycosyltransferase
MNAVGVVILHREHWPEVGDTIRSVLDNGVAPESIVVVDNASARATTDAMRRAFPSLPVVGLTTNAGYAAAMNVGMRTWPDRDTLLLTHDCVLGEGALERLHASFQDPRVGIAGPLLGVRSAPDVVWSAGGVFEAPRQIVHRAFGEPVDCWRDRPTAEVDWLDGACLLVRHGVVRDVGPLDVRYFLYFEETDFTFRARRAGWQVACVTGALAWQEPSARPEALYVRNRLQFLWRQVSRRAAMHQARHEVRRVLRLVSSPDAARRRRGRLAALGVLATVWPADAEKLYRVSMGERRARTAG